MKIISFEGIDGVGKSTVINEVYKKLKEKNKNCNLLWGKIFSNLFFITLIKKCEAEIIRLNKIFFLISNIGDNIATKIIK